MTLVEYVLYWIIKSYPLDLQEKILCVLWRHCTAMEENILKAFYEDMETKIYP